MNNDNVVSLPNDYFVILCSTTKDADGNLIINPQEVAFGKFKDLDNSFYCILNSQSYESLYDNINNLEEGKLYYCFERSLEELRELYGENLENNDLACHYMVDVLDTYNIAIKDGGSYTIHSIPLSVIEKRSDDPIEEITRPESEFELETEKPKPKVEKNEHKEIGKPNIITVDNIGELSSYNSLEIEKYLKERVLGNDRVIENIVTTIIMNLTAKNPKSVKNILNIGPTGTGKTYTFELLSEYLGVPFVIYNTSSLSTAGYQGQDSNDLLKQVYDAAGGNITLANKAIVVLDELDKLRNKELDIKEQAQNDLLALLGGGKVDVELNPHTGSKVTLNTKTMTFVGNGAFTELFDGEIKFNHNPIGFLTSEQLAEQKKNNIIKNNNQIEIKDEQLIKYGMKRELVGRLPKRNVFANQDADGLARMLTDAKESVLNLQIERYLEDFNTELICDKSFIDAFVEFALKEKLGGRSLDKICGNVFERIDRQMLMQDHTEHKVLRLTRKTVENPDYFKFSK